MSEDFSREKIARELVTILDGLLACGDWSSSIFLRAASKRIQMLLDEAKSVVELSSSSTRFQSHAVREAPAGHIPVYISLYQINGNNLKNWQYALRLLAEHNINRPVYREEQFARDLVGSKSDIERHGYAIVYIKEDDIYEFAAPQKDIFGHDLVVLKEGVISLENIVSFVHANKERYSFIDNNLVAES